MTDLNKALADIADMRGQMARGVIFRGYGPEALAATGALAGLAALAQDRWIADPILEIAACPSLPKPMIAVALWYLTTGLLCLAWAREAHALSPLAMGVPFLAGQCLSAILLRHAYRRDHGEP